MLHIFSLFLLWFVGCCLGSFFMVIGTRIPIHQSIIVPRSHCPNCQIPLHPYQLVPLISYFVQKGRCVTCRIKIPFLYPIIEGLSGFCYLVAYLSFGHSPTQFRIILLLISFSLIFIVSDIFYQLLPDSVMFCFFA
ncbi:A24 family peptidase [Carnobacterium maltaromaticum]|uniref:prepilin peptidase n=2 Tax=Carnobacterium maltaromaticum TaxID=2751 RepID=UPI0039BE350D